jgi:hypothetical protein
MARLPASDEDQHGKVEQHSARQDPHPILRGQAEQSAVADEPLQHGAEQVPDEAIGPTLGPAPLIFRKLKIKYAAMCRKSRVCAVLHG